MKSEKPKSIADYIAGLSSKAQNHLEQIRALIKKTVPEAEETISYGIPAFNLNGHYLIYFGGYRDFVSLYPAPRENPDFIEELGHYAGGKGTVHFPVDKALPKGLIKKIIQFRLRENVKKAGNKPKRKVTKNPSTKSHIDFIKDDSSSRKR